MKRIIASLMVAIMAVCGVLVGAPVRATSWEVCDVAETDEEKKMLGCTNTTTAPKMVGEIINVVLGVLGVVAVVVMIIGGIFIMISQGDAGKVKRGRDMLIYGLVGLIVALLSFAIATFVIEGVTGS